MEGAGESLVTRAEDVSVTGLFLSAVFDPRGRAFEVRMLLDDRTPPITASARLARPAVGGMGVAIAPAAARFELFVVRVARRSSRLVLVAAAGGHAEPIARELAACGYAALAADALDAVTATAERSVPPDLVLLHDSLGTPTELRPLRRTLDRFGVRYHLLGDAAPAWSQADAALGTVLGSQDSRPRPRPGRIRCRSGRILIS